MRTIGVITVGRSDYGIYRPLLGRISADPDLQLSVIVGGMHLSPEFGLTVSAIERDGFAISDRVEMLLSSDSPEAIAKSMGLGAMGFAQAYARSRPHMLVVLGDRFEMHAAALAALPFKIPVAHIHGGELTYGAMDDALRHCITKLSHLHFVATDEYKRRVIQLGEEPWRVTLCGALSLDNLRSMALMDLNEIKAEFGADLSKPTLLVTFHPVTLEFERTEWQAAELLAALHECGMQILFTQPNADTSGRLLAAMIERFVAEHSSAHFVNNLGTRAYFSVMTLAAAMVGNSSSGIIEAPSFGLPVVNIGTRQKGRTRAANVIDVGYRRSKIAEGIRRACDARFRASLSHLSNPYSHGEASEIIVSKIKEVALDEALILKRFYEDSFKIEN